MPSYTPKDSLRYALRQALAALERDDWDDLLGHLDVAQHTVKDAQAWQEEHEPFEDVAYDD